MRTDIIPSIKEIKITGSSEIFLSDFSMTDMFSCFVPVASETFEEFSVGLGGDKKISGVVDREYGDYEYGISVTADHIYMKYATYEGAYYSVVTLCQIARLNHNTICECEIHDFPDMNMRAVSDDISRGQISSLENFKSVVRRLSYWKYNVYMPYIEDTFRFEFMPDLGKYSDPVPASEWKELCMYARSYGVLVRPLINLLGHWNKNATLIDGQEFVLTRDGSYLSCLDPENPEVRKLVCNMLDEIVDAFGEGLVHVGGDEVSELASVYGKEKAASLYCSHFRMISEELKKRNCTMMMYSDMFTPVWGDYSYPFETIGQLDDDTEFVFWDYGVRDDYNGVHLLSDSGRKFAVSPASRSYGKFFPSLQVTYENIRNICRCANRKSDSLIISTWNDGGDILREENMIAMSLGGEFGWNNCSRVPYEDLVASFLFLYYGFEDADVGKFLSLYDYEKYFGISDINERAEISSMITSEFWKDARLPTCDRNDLQEKCSEALEKLEKAQDYIKSLTPVKNKLTFDSFKFDVSRLIWTFMRVCVIPTDAFESREEARGIADDLTLLAEDFELFKKEHKRLWNKANRQSEWNYLESRYIDAENALYSLIRYCKYGKRLTKNKFM